MDIYYLLAGGFLLLVFGGDTLVRGAASAATALGVSPLLIGITLVGFGTSTPELVTSLQAVSAGAPGIAVGNVVGSNIANVLLILAVAALIRPIVVDRRAFRRDAPMLLAATAAGVAVVVYGRLDTHVGAGFVGGLLLYMVVTYVQERSRPQPLPEAERLEHEAEFAAAPRPRFWPSLAQAAFGVVVTIVGARLLVSGAVSFARELGVSDTLIGLTVVAIGTSLPELVTSAAAALRRQSDVALGNIVGSNIYNLLGILGITALVQPVAVPSSLAAQDVWVMAGAAALLVWFASRGMRITRADGFLLLMGYVGYTGWLAWSAA